MLVDFSVEISLPFLPGIGWSPGLSDKVNAFLKRPLADNWPYLWLDAT